METLKKQTAIEKLLNKSKFSNLSFANNFKEIIINKVSGYGKNKEALKSFLEDMQKGGCINGQISEFIYHSDCKAFYIKHIDDLEEFKTDFEYNIGESIKNTHELPHYTFVVWLSFEEFCYDIYREVFES